MLELSLLDIKRFWSYIPKGKFDNECWNWKGPVRKYDKRAQFVYSPVGCKQKIIYPSRLIYLYHYGYYNFSLFVCHTCDNGRCVNPKHLFLGTHQDNMTDMKNKSIKNLNCYLCNKPLHRKLSAIKTWNFCSKKCKDTWNKDVVFNH